MTRRDVFERMTLRRGVATFLLLIVIGCGHVLVADLVPGGYISGALTCLLTWAAWRRGVRDERAAAPE